MGATYTNSENQPVERLFNGPPLCNGYLSVTLDANTQPLVGNARTLQASNYVVLTALTGTAATTILAAPSISAGYEGQVISLINATASSSVAIGDDTVAGSGIILGAKRYVLGPGRSMQLQWSANYGSLWKRLDSTLNNATPNFSFTAHAGGGQANATILNNNWTAVPTVATPGDSVKIDWNPTGVGWQFLIANTSTNPMALFPLSGDAFNNLAADASISIAPGSSVMLIDYAVGIWHTIP